MAVSSCKYSYCFWICCRKLCVTAMVDKNVNYYLGKGLIWFKKKKKSRRGILSFIANLFLTFWLETASLPLTYLLLFASIKEWVCFSLTAVWWFFSSWLWDGSHMHFLSVLQPLIQTPIMTENNQVLKPKPYTSETCWSFSKINEKAVSDVAFLHLALGLWLLSYQ